MTVGQIVNVSSPPDPTTVEFKVLAVCVNLREFKAACLLSWPATSEQLAAALGAVGVILEGTRRGPSPNNRMGILLWTDGKVTDMYGNPLRVE